MYDLAANYAPGRKDLPSRPTLALLMIITAGTSGAISATCVLCKT